MISGLHIVARRPHVRSLLHAFCLQGHASCSPDAISALCTQFIGLLPQLDEYMHRSKSDSSAASAYHHVTGDAMCSERGHHALTVPTDPEMDCIRGLWS